MGCAAWQTWQRPGSRLDPADQSPPPFPTPQPTFMYSDCQWGRMRGSAANAARTSASRCARNASLALAWREGGGGRGPVSGAAALLWASRGGSPHGRAAPPAPGAPRPPVLAGRARRGDPRGEAWEAAQAGAGRGSAPPPLRPRPCPAGPSQSACSRVKSRGGEGPALDPSAGAGQQGKGALGGGRARGALTARAARAARRSRVPCRRQRCALPRCGRRASTA